MKIQGPLVNKVGGFIAAATLRSWMSTLDYRAAYYDTAADPLYSAVNGNKIYLLWHEYIPLAVYLRGNCNARLLVSQHRDADILSAMSVRLGFDFVRGSTHRGASAAIRELLAIGASGNIGITPDGPRGPRRVFSQGAIFLASKLRMPLVAMGFGYDRPWRLRSWDRFAVPRPFSRSRLVLSPSITIPQNLDRAGIEHYRLEMERLLNRLTAEAEAWAESGTPKRGQVPLRRLASRKLPPARKIAMGGQGLLVSPFTKARQHASPLRRSA